MRHRSSRGALRTDLPVPGVWGGRGLGSLLVDAPTRGRPHRGSVAFERPRRQRERGCRMDLSEGKTISQLLRQFPEQMLGKLAVHFSRFPLLLKFLDVSKTLFSVQVHPSDDYPELIPAGDTGKTEGWVVLEAGREAAGFCGLEHLARPQACCGRGMSRHGTVVERLNSFRPKSGDGVLIPAGSVHSLCDVVVFEVQQNSDVTFRVFVTGQPRGIPRTGHGHRPLQVEQAMTCIDFARGAIEALIFRVRTDDARATGESHSMR